MSIKDLQVGTVLPNGGVVKAYFVQKDKGIVMCGFVSQTTSYATWEFYFDNLQSTSQGHYFKEAEEAFTDFLARVAKEVYYH